MRRYLGQIQCCSIRPSKQNKTDSQGHPPFRGAPCAPGVENPFEQRSVGEGRSPCFRVEDGTGNATACAKCRCRAASSAGARRSPPRSCRVTTPSACRSSPRRDSGRSRVLIRPLCRRWAMYGTFFSLASRILRSAARSGRRGGRERVTRAGDWPPPTQTPGGRRRSGRRPPGPDAAMSGTRRHSARSDS